jgi:hypothetical protein
VYTVEQTASEKGKEEVPLIVASRSQSQGPNCPTLHGGVMLLVCLNSYLQCRLLSMSLPVTIVRGLRVGEIPRRWVRAFNQNTLALMISMTIRGGMTSYGCLL